LLRVPGWIHFICCWFLSPFFFFNFRSGIPPSFLFSVIGQWNGLVRSPDPLYFLDILVFSRRPLVFPCQSTLVVLGNHIDSFRGKRAIFHPPNDQFFFLPPPLPFVQILVFSTPPLGIRPPFSFFLLCWKTTRTSVLFFSPPAQIKAFLSISPLSPFFLSPSKYKIRGP